MRSNGHALIRPKPEVRPTASNTQSNDPKIHFKIVHNGYSRLVEFG